MIDRLLDLLAEEINRQVATAQAFEVILARDDFFGLRFGSGGVDHGGV